MKRFEVKLMYVMIGRNLLNLHKKSLMFEKGILIKMHGPDRPEKINSYNHCQHLSLNQIDSKQRRNSFR